MDEQGTLSKPIMDLMTGDFNMYHIQTTTQSRAWLYAPVTYMQFYISPDDINHFAAPLKALKDLYALSPGFKEVVSGDAKDPPRHDPQGWMAGGKSVVIMLSGWDSEEALEAALRTDKISAASKELKKRCKLVDEFPCTVTVTEKTRYEHKWRRLPEPHLKDIPI
jgi:quinol monooxygenase YgiN